MTGQLDLSAEPTRRSSRNQRSFKDILAIKRPQIAFRRRVSKGTTMLSMAIGYLLLVAILILTPIWSQTLTSTQLSSLACTDPGGSR